MPGARLPHAWISFPTRPPGTSATTRSSLPLEPVDVSYVTELNEQQIRECQWSTLDLCAPDAFTLILGAKEIQLNTEITQIQKDLEEINVRLNVWRLGTDFDVVRQDWFANELNHTGGMLLRPDQHILMMVSNETTGDDAISVLHSHFGK